MSRQDEINRLKQDIERLHQKNKYEFNYIYEDTQSMNPYPRKSPPQNTNTIYSINNNPIINNINFFILFIFSSYCSIVYVPKILFCT